MRGGPARKKCIAWTSGAPMGGQSCSCRARHGPPNPTKSLAQSPALPRMGPALIQRGVTGCWDGLCRGTAAARRRPKGLAVSMPAPAKESSGTARDDEPNNAELVVPPARPSGSLRLVRTDAQRAAATERPGAALRSSAPAAGWASSAACATQAHTQAGMGQARAHRATARPAAPPGRSRNRGVSGVLPRRILEEDADVDEDVARLLEGADGDADTIRERVRPPRPTVPRQLGTRGSAARVRLAAGHCSAWPPFSPAAQMKNELMRKDMFSEGFGSERPPRISFREVNPFNLWVREQRGARKTRSVRTRHTAARAPVNGTSPGLTSLLTAGCLQVWFEFLNGPPTRRELDLLQALLQAWFMLGKMGGYNSQNMQVRVASSGQRLPCPHECVTHGAPLAIARRVLAAGRCFTTPATTSPSLTTTTTRWWRARAACCTTCQSWSSRARGRGAGECLLGLKGGAQPRTMPATWPCLTAPGARQTRAAQD